MGKKNKRPSEKKKPFEEKRPILLVLSQVYGRTTADRTTICRRFQEKIKVGNVGL